MKFGEEQRRGREGETVEGNFVEYRTPGREKPMDLLEELRAEQHKSQELEAGRRTKRFAEYLALLRRLDQPERNDKARLGKLMKALGFDLATLEDHVAVLADFEAAKAAVGEFEEAEARAERVRPRLEELHEQIVALEREAGPLRATVQALQLPAHAQGKARAEAKLKALGLVFGQLFGTTIPEGGLTSQEWVEVGKANRARARAWGLAPERMDTEDFRRRDEAGSIR